MCDCVLGHIHATYELNKHELASGSVGALDKFGEDAATVAKQRLDAFLKTMCTDHDQGVFDQALYGHLLAKVLVMAYCKSTGAGVRWCSV